MVYVGWCRVKHQWTTIASITLGLFLLLRFRGLVSFLLGLLFGRYGQVFHSLDGRVDGIFDCVRHVVVTAESQARGAVFVCIQQW